MLSRSRSNIIFHSKGTYLHPAPRTTQTTVQPSQACSGEFCSSTGSIDHSIVSSLPPVTGCAFTREQAKIKANMGARLGHNGTACAALGHGQTGKRAGGQAGRRAGRRRHKRQHGVPVFTPGIAVICNMYVRRRQGGERLAVRLLKGVPVVYTRASAHVKLSVTGSSWAWSGCALTLALPRAALFSQDARPRRNSDNTPDTPPHRRLLTPNTPMPSPCQYGGATHARVYTVTPHMREHNATSASSCIHTR